MIALLILILSVSFLVIRHFTWKAQAWPEGALRPPQYQGHRGYWKEGAQENTLASFMAAKKRGLQMIEMDVRLSKDNVVVVFHDNDLKRLGNVEKLVNELTAAELATASQVVSLEALLQSNDIPPYLNIELKTDKAFDGSLETEVAKLVRKHKAEKRILFSSFNPLAINRLKKLLPEVPRALLATKEDDPANRFYLKHMLFAPYIGANALHLDYNYVSIAELEKWNRRKIPVAFWTVNDPAVAKNLLQHGALSIISDTLV
ncbi:glycerophosphodiester phosphodiesterase [Bdellovibrio sp. NC01]|uniref:glycerophosphodiester phosphodiesterase n=1 Tax=Bdellovibrio sp. NC01 TaxID=2220073 RepID=UPI00115AAB48|nr:glycerophosphodiester phosphodiesterase [Bdellovibrio sp. NC01]QDK38076.1 glycerophosphodiester phosphodiesterase [Bdellovibrio sp. NC01]